MSTRTLLFAAIVVGSGLSVAAGSKPARAHVSTASIASLWEAPAAVHQQDLFNGPYGAKLAPDPNDTYTFLHRKRDGVNPGVVVKDSRGRTWHVKQAPDSSRGAEGPVEVAISRVLSAVGYHQPPVYFLSSFVMTDESGRHVEPGGRFRLDLPSMHSRGEWSWEDNPFIGTRPYDGLLAILLAFNSWDLKASNNRIYDVTRGGRVENWYVVRDLGGALGESEGLTPKRNNLERFERSRYIAGVDKGFGSYVKFSYHGKHPSLVDKRITLDDVRWASNLLSQLDDRQWHDAFRAGGYGDVVSDRFIAKIRSNIAQGIQLTNPAWRSAQDGR